MLATSAHGRLGWISPALLENASWIVLFDCGILRELGQLIRVVIVGSHDLAYVTVRPEFLVVSHGTLCYF